MLSSGMALTGEVEAGWLPDAGNDGGVGTRQIRLRLALGCQPLRRVPRHWAQARHTRASPTALVGCSRPDTVASSGGASRCSGQGLTRSAVVGERRYSCWQPFFTELSTIRSRFLLMMSVCSGCSACSGLLGDAPERVPNWLPMNGR